MKICKTCGVEITLENVVMNGTSTRSFCRKCINEKHMQNYVKRKTNNFENLLLARTKSKAKERQIFFDLNLNDFVIPKICPIFDIELKLSDNKPCDNSPSIDRINNNLGYIKNNIIFISWKANRFKGEASLAEMKLIYDNFYIKNNLIDINQSCPLYYIKHKLSSAKSRSKLNLVEFNLNPSDIIVPYKCPILGIDIISGLNKRSGKLTQYR